jgi:hypothetical protein
LRNESSNETDDRVWRRWLSFCEHACLASNPYLIALLDHESELIIRAFLGMDRHAAWDKHGRLTGRRSSPVVAGTVCSAASSLAAAFRNNIQHNPFHLPESTNMRPTLRALLRAYDNTDPGPKRLKAITPKLLRYLFQSTGLATDTLLNSAPAVIADITIAGFFFAMRSCKYSKTPVPGKTKIILLSGIVFRTTTKQQIEPTDPLLLVLAQYVTITFVDQKSGKKMDPRTQQRTGHPFLCPLLRYASVVQRIHQLVPNWTPQTQVNTIRVDNKTFHITNSFMRKLLRASCQNFGGKATFGFDPKEIGNKSIRSGAAMALFLQNISSTRIMLLGRWASEACLAYIRPQVLEWTNNMSRDMINIDSFFKANPTPSMAPNSQSQSPGYTWSTDRFNG